MIRIAHAAFALVVAALFLPARAGFAQDSAAGLCGGVTGLQCPAGMVCKVSGAPHPVGAGLCQPTGGRAICPQNYEPVCGGDGKTYPNACVARMRGAGAAHDGQCEAPGPLRPPPPPPYGERG